MSYDYSESIKNHGNITLHLTLVMCLYNVITNNEPSFMIRKIFMFSRVH